MNDRSVAQRFLSEADFGQHLMAYVMSRPGKIREQSHAERDRFGHTVPDHWTADSVRGNRNATVYAESGGMFDALLGRSIVTPKNWDRFRRQYFNPTADLLERLLHECEYPRSHAWTGNDPGRNGFHMDDDFWTKKTQEDNYRDLLRGLELRGLLQRRASRRYEHDPEAAQVLSNGIWVDIPGTYRNLSLAVENLWQEGGYKTGLDLPLLTDPYGSRKPLLFLVGSTVEVHRDLSERKAGLDFIRERTSGEPRYQEVLYVLAEAWGAERIPRYLGRMEVVVAEMHDETVVGKALSELRFLVPQRDLTENETRSLWCDQENWKAHNGIYLDAHKGLEEFVEARTR